MHRLLKNNCIVDSGQNHCLLRTNEAGTYHVEIDSLCGTTLISKKVTVTVSSLSSQLTSGPTHISGVNVSLFHYIKTKGI